MEIESEVSVNENFKQWKIKDRISLIIHILLGKEWEFIGLDTIYLEPHDWKIEAYD